VLALNLLFTSYFCFIAQSFHEKFFCDIFVNSFCPFVASFFSRAQYFPTTIATWIVYCVIIFVLVTTLKLINLSLHKMYDKARTLSETSLKKLSSGNTASGIASSKIQRETSG
jgi:hypothetical protein